jgi:hypothetical protein
MINLIFLYKKIEIKKIYIGKLYTNYSFHDKLFETRKFN